ACRLDARKGVDLVLTALQTLHETEPSLVASLDYWVTGFGGELERLHEQARAAGFEVADGTEPFARDHTHSGPRVRFLGNVPDQRMLELYAAADIFALVTHISTRSVEGFGMFYLEASACRIPCVGSDVGGVSSALEDGVSGLLVPAVDAQAAAEALAKLL